MDNSLIDDETIVIVGLLVYDFWEVSMEDVIEMSLDSHLPKI